MTFAPLPPRTVRWRPLRGEGLEHLSLAATPSGVLARSTVIGSRDGAPYGLAYQIRCDDQWRVRELRVRATNGAKLLLCGDGEGRWRDENGTPLPAFEGCIDVDIWATPFTNTLPIRRLDLRLEDGTAELSMIYVGASLQASVDAQRYTCLSHGQLYRYQASDRSFTADLPVDGDGLVTDYPTLFTRA